MFTLTVTMLEVLWAELRLPPMPARIAVAQHGETLEDRARIRERTLVAAERGGLGRPPRLDRRLADLFAVLGGHDRALSLREPIGRRRRAYVAADGPRGAVCVIEGGRVALSAGSGDHLVDEFLRLLPPAPAGPGRPLTVPTAVFDAAIAAYADPRDGTEARRILTAAGIGGGDVERLLATARDLVDSGSIGVHAGGALTGSLAYTDTGQGRYAVLRRDDRSDRSHTSLVPAGPDGLRRRLHELLGTTVS